MTVCGTGKILLVFSLSKMLISVFSSYNYRGLMPYILITKQKNVNVDFIHHLKANDSYG